MRDDLSVAELHANPSYVGKSALSKIALQPILPIHTSFTMTSKLDRELGDIIKESMFALYEASKLKIIEIKGQEATAESNIRASTQPDRHRIKYRYLIHEELH